MIGVTAKKDIKKGEKINFPLKITLPTFEQEAIAELLPKGFKKQLMKIPLLKGRLDKLGNK